MSRPYILEIAGARRRFGDRTALAGVDLFLRPGEIYALLGRNGAGKTTLVRAICGRVRLDEGTVRLDGRDPRTDAGARRRLGLVPQEIALYADLTVRENLECFGRLAGLPRSGASGASAQALDWIGLADRAGSRVAVLSGGMKRRVNLAAGVLHRPDVLLLDEPTAGVDPQARERIHELLADLRARGMAILLTTHDLDQAEGLADRIGILDDGALKAEGAFAELKARTFGDHRHVGLAFAEEPGVVAVTLLEELGLVPASGDARRWSGALGGEFADAAAIGRRAAETGLAVTELSVREPDLYSVFFRVTGREIAE